MLAVILFAFGIFLPWAAFSDGPTDAPVALGSNATGADLKEKMQKTFDEVEKALNVKRNAGTISEDEREILESLADAKAALEETDPADLDAIATLASGKSIEVVPDAEAQAAGVKPFTFTAADLVKAQEDAVKMSAAAEAFAKSESGRALEAAATLESSGGGSSSGGGRGSVWDSSTAAGGRRVVTAAAAADEGEGMGGMSVSAESEGADTSTNSLDAVDFGILKWDFGGFRPATECLRSEVEISGLKIASNGLSFRYVHDLSVWGLGYGEAEALACLFVCDNDGNWVGGKFDWISSSRTKRSFENVYGGYGGWSLSRVPNPCPAAFVIVSRDGRKRSNVISGIWER